MCHYEQTVFTCGDWKWGNMRERCPRQHRMGETCGSKLIHHDFLSQSVEKCRVCKDVDIKKRKLEKERQNIERWRKEGRKFLASMEKAENEVERLLEAIQVLENSRAIRKLGPQAPRHDALARTTVLPSVLMPTPLKWMLMRVDEPMRSSQPIQQLKDVVDRHAGMQGTFSSIDDMD
jgi:hypothetical protein